MPMLKLISAEFITTSLIAADVDRAGTDARLPLAAAMAHTLALSAFSSSRLSRTEAVAERGAADVWRGV
eukprot:2528195-Prymnesium_polylepis.1